MESRIPGHPPGWHLVFDPHLPGWPQLFRSRRECRAWIEKHHGYIRQRPDLQKMGFTMPRATMVSIVKATEASMVARVDVDRLHNAIFGTTGTHPHKTCACLSIAAEYARLASMERPEASE